MSGKRDNGKKKVCFQVKADPGSEVFVAGTFNDWNPCGCRLRNKGGNGLFESKLLLPPGRYEYKFVVNGAWVVDEGTSERIPNHLGSENSVITV